MDKQIQDVFFYLNQIYLDGKSPQGESKDGWMHSFSKTRIGQLREKLNDELQAELFQWVRKRPARLSSH